MEPERVQAAGVEELGCEAEAVVRPINGAYPGHVGWRPETRALSIF